MIFHPRTLLHFGLLFVVLGISQAGALAAKPLKVFILAGQSNMQGHAHIRTFDAMALSPATAPLLKEMQDDQGQPIVCEKVWISSIGSSAEEKTGQLTAGFGAEKNGPKVGPEFTFGITMQKLLGEPILIIKTAWGGKSLHTDFRSPGGGAFEFSPEKLEQFKAQGKDIEAVKAEKAEATGHYYRLMMEHVKSVLADIKRVYPDYDLQGGYEVAGFVWFQGWNDLVDRGVYPSRDKSGGYDLYSRLMAQFIRDVRSDLSTPDMPFVIGVLGVNGPLEAFDSDRYKPVYKNFRSAQAAPAGSSEFKGSVAAVLTEKYWDLELMALKAREAKFAEAKKALEAKAKAKEISRDESRHEIDKLYAAEFSPKELQLLRESVSNAGFHYMGSARIMSQIGKAFAEEMKQMMD